MKGNGMSLEDTINASYIDAMKARNTDRSAALNFLRAQIKNVKIDKRVEKVSDEDVIAIIKKQIKQRQDSIAQFNSGGRPELAAKEEAEMKIYQEYLPTQLSVDAVKKIVDEVATALGASGMKDMGRVMKEVLVKLAGQADGQVVSQSVKERLSA